MFEPTTSVSKIRLGQVLEPLADATPDETTQSSDTETDIEPVAEEEETDAPETESGDDGETDDPEAAATTDEDVVKETEDEAPQAATLDEEILAAVKDAGTAPDAQKAVAKMAKRIKSFKDERDAERNERLRLQQEIATLKAKPQAATTAATAEAVSNPAIAALNEQISKIEEALEVIATNPDGYSWTTTDGKEKSLSGEELRTMSGQHNKQLRTLEAKRAHEETRMEAQAAEQRSAAMTQARQLYPWITQQDSQEYKLAMDALRAMGPAASRSLVQNPEFELIMGRFITGLQAEQKVGKKPGILPSATSSAQPVRRAPANVVPGPGLRGSRTAGLQQELKAAEKELERTGSADAFTRVTRLEQRIAANAAS